MPQLYIGTSGWSYKDWVGPFYLRPQSGTFDFLEFYSDYFNSVEVNSTYYTFLNPKIAEGWIRKVESKEEFFFTIKLHQNFTHARNYTTENTKAVKEVLDLLDKAGRLSGLLIQFPYSFMLDSKNAWHVKALIDTFAEYEKYVEVRHNSWYIDRFFNFLKENKSTLCTIDQPIIGQAVEFNPVIVGETAYFRLHGRNEKAWSDSISSFGKEQTYDQQNKRYNYLYSPAELIDIGSKVKEIMNQIKKIIIYFNNHPKGQAAANAFELLNFLKDNVGINIPETTLKAFPRLSKITSK